MVGVPIGTDEYVLERAMGVMKDGGADRLAPCLANMPGMQAAAPITINSLGQRTSYLEKAPDTRLSLEACRRADNGAQWAYEILELPGAAEALSFFQEGCPVNQLTLSQQAQACLSAGVGGLELPLTAAR